MASEAPAAPKTPIIDNLRSPSIRAKNAEMAVVLMDMQVKQAGLSESLEGLHVLDLGCGSQINYKGVVYEPFLCRELSKAGANVVGVDIGPAFPEDGQTYTHRQIDLIPAVLHHTLRHDLQDQQFEIINATGFAGQAAAPELLKALGEFSLTRDPFNNIGTFDDELLVEVVSLLKEGGLFYIDNKCFQKKDGELVRLKDY